MIERNSAIYFVSESMALAATMLNYLTVGRLLKIKKQWRYRGLLFAGCILMTNMVIFIADPVNLPPTFLAFLVGIFVCCEGSRLKKLTMGIMMASVIFSANALLDNFLPLSIWNYKYLLRLLFAVIMYLTVCFFQPDKDSELSPGMWKMLLLLTVVPMGIVLTVVLGTTESQRYYSGTLTEEEMWLSAFKGMEQQYLILLFLALISFAGLLWTAVILARQRRLEEQSMYEQMNRNYYEAMEQQHFEIRRLRHDMANHLQALAALQDTRREAYIQTLLEDGAMTRNLKYCGDSTVNAVLSVKAAVMEKLGIEFVYRLDIPEELSISRTDVCALFANALDNAVEACEKLSGEKRRITLESRIQKGLFALSVKNPLPGEELRGEYKEGKAGFRGFKGGALPETTKRDFKNHGLGLKSIREIVKRREGNMEIQTEDGMFELFLYFPV